MVRAIVFDLGGVLTGPVWTGLQDYGVELGLAPSTLVDYFRGDPEFARVEVGELSLRSFLKGVCVRVERAHDCRVDIRRLAAAADVPRRLDPAMLELVGELAPHVRLGVLTNNARESEGWWRALLPHGAFQAVVDSSEVGLRKPDPRAYEHVLSLLAVAPAEAVLVDDTQANLPPAAALGMTALLFESEPLLRAQLVELGALPAPVG